MRTRFKREDLAFHFEHFRIEVLSRYPGVGGAGGIKESDIYIWAWSSEDIHTCRS